MEEDNKVFHQAKAEVWEKLAVVEQLMRIYKLGKWKTEDGNEILHKLPTCLDLRVLINDLQNRVNKEISNSNVFGSLMAEGLLEEISVAEDEMEHHGHRL